MRPWVKPGQLVRLVQARWFPLGASTEEIQIDKGQMILVCV